MADFRTMALGAAAAVCVIVLAGGLAACVSEPPPDTGGPAAQRTSAGMASRGLVYAEDNCASCHAIAAGEAVSPNPLAPPFEELAATPGMTSIALSAWMQSAHRNMPTLRVSQDHVDDLWAYLETLKTTP